MESVTLSPLDLRIVHALQLDGRAPFSRIAGVVDVSDRTVARRFGRLRASGAVRVTGVADSRRTGRAEWVVRLRVLPDGAQAVVDALARRADTAWVALVSGGTEIVCLFRTADGGPVPLAALTRHPRVVQADAQRLLRHLMDHRWRGRTSALTAEQVAAIRGPRHGAGHQAGDEHGAGHDAGDTYGEGHDAGDEHGTGHGVRSGHGGTAVPRPRTLTELDRRLLSVLAADGRTAYPDLARAVGWSESAVRRRLAELRGSRTVRFDVETDPRLFGFSAQCLLWLTVAPSRISAVARAVASDAETAFVGATTGAHHLMAVVVCRDEAALYDYVSDRIGALDGVQRVDTALVSDYAKRAGARMG
ncbi:Lrp/AsnC family transcriptional regulator [Streptomyces sp. MST-110588]|uniref:Lrp/AsnC family transcriptional regulator n=1 Tax=Streptomyces sp. MST-110588 TaxID=2833628 RepID=UPI001F5E1893|nr:Lrp/AsnC family transcriptional regulator [Streptomyces sp. MST-110588]